MHATWVLMLLVVVAVAALYLLIAKVRLEPFIALTVVSIALGLAAGLPLLDHKKAKGVITVMTAGLGSALSKIAALITLGAILSEVLRVSGASQVLGARMLKVVGPRRGPLAMTLCGLVVGVTIFFDPAVILLAPLSITLAKQSRRSIIFFAIPMATAVLAMHALLPPHPGPIAIAGVLGVNYGLLVVFGVLCVLPGVAAAYGYGQWVGRRLPAVIADFGGVAASDAPSVFGADDSRPLPSHGLVDGASNTTSAYNMATTSPALLPDTQPVSGAAAATAPAAVLVAPREEAASHVVLPSLSRTLFCLLLPIILILLQTLTSRLSQTGPLAGLLKLLQFLGNPWVALTISCLVGFALLVVGLGRPRGDISVVASAGLRPVGQILMTSAGGAVFGSVISASGIGHKLLGALSSSGIPVIVFAFLITALLRATLGTTTAAVIAVATLIGPTVLHSPHTSAQLALIAIAIAAGGMCLSHFNDTGFWVLSRYFGIPETAMLRSWTVAVTIMGVSTLAIASIFYGIMS